MRILTRPGLRLSLVALTLPSLALLALAQGRPAARQAAQKIDFGRDIQPILANNCLECHGVDEHARKAGLRLDTFEGAKKALVPGHSAKSRVMARIMAEDGTRMPPESSGKRLTASQVALVKAWIDQGAKYAQHWAFVPPKRPAVPAISPSPSGRVGEFSPRPGRRADSGETGVRAIQNPIDSFVLARLRKEGLKPSPEADRATLLRRVHLDLTGLPPSPQQVRDFLADRRPDAYERVVDRLLASPHYGERWARRWLDVARYADTNGYEKDRERSIWPYRDWVIKAINADMPFDQFTIEQLAGDLLPNATQDQIIATGFHRNTMTNEEGGIDLAEDRFKSMIDRVNTTGAAWLGLTVGCAQCHSHKYDPISQKEYYGLYAFLNNTDEVDLDVVSQDIKAKREEIERKISEIERTRVLQFSGAPEWRLKLRKWIVENTPLARKWKSLKPTQVVSANRATMTVLSDNSVLASGDKPNTDTYEVTVETDLPRVTAIRLEVLTHPSLPDNGPGRAHFFQRAGFMLSEFGVEARPRIGGELKPVKLVDPTADFEASGRPVAHTLDDKLDTGWMITGQEGKDHRAVFPLSEPISNPGGTTLKIRMDQFLVHQTVIGRFRISVTDQPLPVKAAPFPADVEEALSYSGEDAAREGRLVGQKVIENDASRARSRLLEEWFLRSAPETQLVDKQIADLRKQMPAYPTTRVLQERPGGWERVTHLYQRGEFLKPKETVGPAVPKVLPAFPVGQPANRLGLAKWLVSPQNPLTARVVMNRYWHAFFGRGLVETLEDFGTRGDLPSHPELLDWLATEFMRGGWKLKRMHRLIVTSATYRQSARVTPELLKRDPSNVLLARGPRFRVDAEAVRDIALAASGLLNAKIGGPGVYPPQPGEVTAQVYGGYSYPTSQGSDRYRRGMYVHWKRTAPFASFITFDAPTSEASCLRRVRSNTPLQALTLLNDAVFMEASQVLAKRVLREGGPTDASRIEHLFLCALSRLPRPAEADKVSAFLRKQKVRFTSDSAAAKAVSGGEGNEGNLAEWAAWTLTARAVLNLDEAITKQ